MKAFLDFRIRIAMSLGIVLVIATFTGCRQSIDLDTVRALSKSASDAQQSLDNVSQDFHDTCVRKLRWDYLTASVKGSPVLPVGPRTSASVKGSPVLPVGPRTSASVEGSPVLPPVRRRTGASNLLVPSDPYSATRCDDPTTLAAVEQMKLFNHLYIGYFVALGNIAGSKSDTNAYGIQDFAKSLKTNPGLKDVKGVTESATFLTAAIDEYFNARKKNAISTFAGGQGEAFVNDTSAKLIKSSDDLKTQLGFEEDAVDDFYNENIKHAKPGTDMLSALRFRKDWAADLADVQARRDALAAYQKVVRDLQKSHATLVDSIRNNKPNELASIAQLYIAEFSPLVGKMDKAFK